MLRFQFLGILLLTLLAAFVAPRVRPGIDLAGGAELRYKVLFDSKVPGDRAQLTKEAADVLRRRLESKQLKEPKITSHGDDEIILQLAGVDSDELRDIKRLIETTGKLELYAAAPQELQERFDQERLIPSGTKAVGKGRQLLVEERPVIEGRNIVVALPQQTEDARWVTLFELDRDGARRFDEAAERLYGQQPRGRIVIVLDGEIRSAPVVESPSFHGRGQITASREERK